MRIVFCDDDPLILEQLQGYVTEFFRQFGGPMPELTAYETGDLLIAQEPRADIAFLDVEMPGSSGIHVGARLQNRNPYLKIFIVTCYADYLDEAMKFHVFRYLSKPLDRARLFRNMKDALYQLNMDTRPVLIETAKETVTRYADEIVMVEAMGRKVMVHAVDRRYESLRKMGEWEKLLDIGCFVRTHRSFLINMKYVSSFSDNLIFLTAPDGTRYSAYLARRRYRSFKDAYLLYVETMR